MVVLTGCSSVDAFPVSRLKPCSVPTDRVVQGVPVFQEARIEGTAKEYSQDLQFACPMESLPQDLFLVAAGQVSA